jgi:membrane protein implicated in regulation of membrane protease activity
MAWWSWMLVGFALLAVELFTPGGFFVMFFGAGAILVGLLVLAELTTTPWVEWAVFTVASVASLLVLRPRLVSRMRVEGRDVDTMVGEAGTMLSDVGTGQLGKAELRGSAWNARNVGERALRQGDRVRVVQIDGLTIMVRAE